MQFALNALFGIGIGWLFVRLAERSGGSADEQALAFFLPGILWSGIYSFVVVLTCLTGWPLIGFMLGGVTGEPTAWHEDKQVVQLCTRLTWVLVLPGLIGVTLQAPVWFAGWSGMMAADTAVLVLGTLRFGLGWPLRFAALAGMTWLLARDHTPLQPVVVEPASPEPPSPEPRSRGNEPPGRPPPARP